jgi:hypothetical protein
MLDMGLDVLGDLNSPVMPVMMYSPIMIAAFSHACLAAHVATVVVAFPATPLALARTRICISAAHSREDIEYALEVGGRWALGWCSYSSHAGAGAGASAAMGGLLMHTPRAQPLCCRRLADPPGAALPPQVLASVTGSLKLQFKSPSTLDRLRNLLTHSK